MKNKLNEEPKGIEKYIMPILGTFLLLIGITFMIFPFLPFGYLFTIIGILFLATSIPFFKKIINYLKKKDKKNIVEKAEKHSEKIERKIQKKIKKVRNENN
jgi:uncharacterized membrane protein HdeD (DUF308 family)